MTRANWQLMVGTAVSGATVIGRNHEKSKLKGKTYLNCICSCGNFFCRERNNLVRGGKCRKCAIDSSNKAKLVGNIVEHLGDGTHRVDISTKSNPSTFMIIDDDFLYLIDNKVRWYARRDHGLTYAVRIVNRKIERFHRMALRAPNGMQVDHVSGDTLDNRRVNLRLVRGGDNQRNMSKSIANKSGFTGVCLDKKSGKWLAQIKHDGKNKRIGLFDDLYKAAEARKAAEVELGFHVNHGRDKPPLD